MSRNSTSIKLMGSSRNSTKLHVGTFMTEVNLAALPEPIKMFRKPNTNEPRKQTASHRFGYTPPEIDDKNLPLIIEDGERTTTTGVYDEAPGVYMMFVKEGNVMRAYPIASWFRFGAPKPVETEAPQVPVVKSEGVNQKLIRRLGALARTSDSGSDHSRLKATRESRFAGGTEDGEEVGEGFDFDENFDDDETILSKEDQEANEDEAVPKKLSKRARQEQSRLKAGAEFDPNEWVYELLYGDSDDEGVNDDEEEEDGDKTDENGMATGEPNLKKRPREGDADEGRGEPKRRAASGKQAKITQDEQFRKDRHAVITTLRSAFLNSPTLESAQIIKVLRNAIPNFAVGPKPGAPKEETQNRERWTFILKQVLNEYTNPLGGNKFSWKQK
jgi:hypothetical protein